MATITIFAPAKLNLFLAVTGRREDGFHDLVSVVAPVAFGDTLHGELADACSLRCTDPDVPVDESNLVLRAARLFAEASGWSGGVAFTLEKKIPVGAGLGGGSSDGVAALRLLNRLAGDRLPAGALAEVAAQLGSDCPLFLHDAPVILRGRGERIEPLPAEARQRIRGRRVLVFKPAFAVPTPWAYARLAAGAPATYLAREQAEAQLAGWLARADAPIEELLFNNMEPPVFAKYVALPVLLDQIASRFAVQPRMSGSGSACFAVLPDDAASGPLQTAIREAWGDSAFALEARLG